nr:hypothetical protein [Tanacetum cinerariifolium]
MEAPPSTVDRHHRELIEEPESTYANDLKRFCSKLIFYEYNAPNMFSIRIHHGGKFISYPGRMYVSGRVDIFDMVNINLFTVVALNMMVLKLGYTGESEPMFYNYLRPLTSLDVVLYALACEKDVRCLATLVRSFKLIEVYIEHGVTVLDSYLRAPRFRATLEDITDEPLSGAHGVDTKSYVLPTIQSLFSDINLSFVSQQASASQVIDDVMRQLSFDETELDGEAGFADVPGSGVDIKTQYELPVSEEPDVGPTQDLILAEISTQEPIVAEVNTQELIVAKVSTDTPIVEEGNGQKDETAPTDGQLFYDDEGIYITYETENDVQSIEDAGTDDDDDDVDEDFLVDEENEILEPDVDVHLFGISKDLPFDNIGITNLVLDDVLEGEEEWKVSRIEDENGSPKEAKDKVYLHSIKSKRNLKLYKNDSVKIRARSEGKVPVFTMSQDTGPTGPYSKMKAGPSGSSGPTTKSKKEEYRAKDKAERNIRGDHVLQYSMLRDYAVELQSTNPNTTVKIAVERNTNPSLLTRCLGDDINLHPNSNFTFISDRQKGIILAIKTVYLSAEHRYCLQHIHENMKQGWCGQAYKDLLWRVASATNVSDFEKCMLELKMMNPKAHEWLNKIPAEHWARSHFSVEPNLIYFSTTFVRSVMPLTPTTTRIMESIKKESHLMNVQWNGANKYQVSGILCKHVVAAYWNMALNDRATPPPETWVGRPKKKRKRSKHKDEPFVKDGGNNAEGSGNASRQAQQIELAVGQDGSGGSGVGVIIGLFAAAGKGGAGVASQAMNDNGKFPMVDEEEATSNKLALMAEEMIMLEVLKRNCISPFDSHNPVVITKNISVVIDYRKFMMVNEEDLILKKISPMAAEILEMLRICVAKK